MTRFLMLAIALTILQGTWAIPMSLLACLQRIRGDPNSFLTTPSSTNYNTDRLGLNLNFDYKPRAIYHPANAADAAAAIRCAAAHKVPIAPRSGGHSYEGYSEGGQNGSLILDIHQLQYFAFDANTTIATVGAGTRLGALYTRLWGAGPYLVPAGTCPTVGIGGHALGGGIGMASRKYGVLTDSIVSMTMIDAEGKTRHVSATSEPDLFWALRGAGGGSFGLVTEFKLQAYKAPRKVTTLVYTYPLTSYRAVIDGFGRWCENGTEDMFGILGVRAAEIMLKLNYLGPLSDALAAVEPLLQRTGKPTTSKVREGNWYEAATQWAAYNGAINDPDKLKKRYHRGGSIVYRQQLTQAEMDIFYEYLTHPPSGGNAPYVLIEVWGGQIGRASSPASFDHHRKVVVGIHFGVGWSDAQQRPGIQCPTCDDWDKRFREALYDVYPGGRGAIQAYQNYIERDLPDSLHAYYGDGLPRLKQIKTAVDPNNLFSYPQSIPLLTDKKSTA